MAITWEVTITPLNVDRKEANIVAVRTDDNDPDNVKTETHTIISAILNTQTQKTAALDNIWEQHLAWQVRQIKIDNYIGDLEVQAKINLEARES